MKHNAEVVDKSSLTAAETGDEMNNKIRCRAYELFEQRGKADGSDLEDWVQAEAETRSDPKMKGSTHLFKAA